MLITRYFGKCLLLSPTCLCCDLSCPLRLCFSLEGVALVSIPAKNPTLSWTAGMLWAQRQEVEAALLGAVWGGVQPLFSVLASCPPSSGPWTPQAEQRVPSGLQPGSGGDRVLDVPRVGVGVWGSSLVCWGCRHRAARPAGLREHQVSVSAWRLEVRGQGAGRTGP